MQDQKAEQEKKRKVIRVRPGEKTKPTVESLERLRQTAEEKGWVKKSK
ncbi:MAG: hypothetical protein ABSF48_15295 [Thermodesulfobacteriota bacterium]|jgi:hypothetical protein